MARTGLIEAIEAQVRRNCRVSDARHWGTFSTCGLLLRLREMYRFEHRLPHDAPLRTSDVSAWIGGLEAEWQSLESAAFAPITIDGRAFDPFDAEGINEILLPTGHMYAAGIGAYGKAIFFLAEHLRTLDVAGCRALVAGRELARDLSLNPAMSRGGLIIGRMDMAVALIREKHAEHTASRGRSGLLTDAFTAYGMAGSATDAQIASAAETEMDAYLRHEAGEVIEGRRLGEAWIEMLSEANEFPRASVMLRGIKDALADSTREGMLAHIIATRSVGALALYLHFLSGPRHTLAEPVRKAYPAFRGSRDWEPIETARASVYQSALAASEAALAAYSSAGDNRAESIEHALGPWLACKARA